MFCPNCGAEYRDGFKRCADCEVDLVAELPGNAATPEVRLVKVFESGNAAVIPVVESLFAGAGIEFMTKGGPIQDLFGWGRFASNLNFAIGPVEFFVREDDVEEATQMIAAVATGVPPNSEDEPAG